MSRLRTPLLATFAGVCLIIAGTLIGVSHSGPGQVQRETDVYSNRSPDSRIQYAVARGLLDGYGGKAVRLVMTDAPCGNSGYNGCVERRGHLAGTVQLNVKLDYPFIAKTISHEYAHTLNTRGIYHSPDLHYFEGEVVAGLKSEPAEVLADCASQILTHFAYRWDTRTYLERDCDSHQLAVAHELLEGRFSH